jgi:hypothetical protein
MAHTTDQPKGQTHCSLLIADKEIMSLLGCFVEEMKLNIGPKEMQQFLSIYKQRRSLFRLGKDIVLHICSFMDLCDTLVLLKLCRVFASWLPDIWRIYEHMYFEGSTIPTSKATMIYLKQNIAIDRFAYRADRSFSLHKILEDISVPERRIVKLGRRNKKIYNSDQKRFRNPRPLPNTVLEYKSNCAEIASCENELAILYGNASDDDREYLEMFRWLCPNGYFFSMPKADDRLYTGIVERAELQYARRHLMYDIKSSGRIGCVAEESGFVLEYEYDMRRYRHLR